MIFRTIAAVLAAFTLIGCAGTAQRAPSAAPGAKRIVSLIPSLTEDLFAIGAGARVVGVSRDTDWPAAAARLPVVASYGALDVERVIALHPDVVVGIAYQAGLTTPLVRAGIPVVLYRDDTYDDIFRDLTALGTLTGRRSQAVALCTDLRRQAHALQARVPARRLRPSVFVVLGVSPIFTVGAGSYIARLIDMAGGRNAANDVRAPYPRYSAEALVAKQPDVLIVDPATNFASTADRAPWNALRAVREHRAFELARVEILERPGPRFVQGLRWLANRLASVPS